MKVQFLGFRQMRFRAQDGTEMSGTKLFYAHEQDGVSGLACGSMFASAEKFGLLSPAPGSQGNIEFNQYGKPISIEC